VFSSFTRSFKTTFVERRYHKSSEIYRPLNVSPTKGSQNALRANPVNRSRQEPLSKSLKVISY